MPARPADSAPFDTAWIIGVADLQPTFSDSRCGSGEGKLMITHMISRSPMAHGRSRRDFVFRGTLVWGVVGLVVLVTGPTRGDDEADVDVPLETRLASQPRPKTTDPSATVPDPLKGAPPIKPETTGQDAAQVLAKMLRPRSDSWADWSAPVEALHRCGEPRALPPCVPPPPCHPSMPPAPYDLVGVRGERSNGPIYQGPCRPRTGTHDDCPHPHLQRLSDRFFDCFYMWK